MPHNAAQSHLSNTRSTIDVIELSTPPALESSPTQTEPVNATQRRGRWNRDTAILQQDMRLAKREAHVSEQKMRVAEAKAHALDNRVALAWFKLSFNLTVRVLPPPLGSSST